MRELATDARWWKSVPMDGTVGVGLEGAGARARAVLVDAEGVLWVVAFGERPELVRWALSLRFRVFPELGLLLKAVGRCEVIGLLPRLGPRLGVPLGGTRVWAELVSA